MPATPRDSSNPDRNQELQFDIPQGPITYEQWVLHSVGQLFAEEIEVAKNRGYRPTGGQTKLVTDGGRPAFIDPQTDWVECYICGQHIEDMSRVEGLDVSQDDEYYPDMKPVCRTHKDDSDGDGV